ncbi:MAG: multiubiquitin domain-containing protein [Sphingomicrobium sp.]
MKQHRFAQREEATAMNISKDPPGHGNGNGNGNGNKDEAEIVVNAQPKTVEDRQISFEEVVEIAFPGGGGAGVVFSVTYRHAASVPHAGELSAGNSIEAKKKGTVFNVTRTVQS